MPAKKTPAKVPAAKPAAKKKAPAGKPATARPATVKKAAAAKKAPAVKKAAAVKKAPAAKKAAAVKKPAPVKAASPVPPPPPAPPKPQLPPLVARIQELLAEKKAEKVVVLDMRKLSSVTDFFVLATGTSGPQLRAMSEDLAFRLKKEGHPAHRRAGSPESGWMIVDYIDVVVHMMSPEARGYYALEDLWNDAPKFTQG
ncbi:MAG: ribosome silencing factor [Kiritimatiellia bacterium]